MRTHTLLRLGWFAACLAFFPLAGCTDKTTSVSGKLILPNDISVAENDSVTIVFMPEKDGKTIAGLYSPAEKTFTAKEIAPGSYKITVRIVPYPGKDSDKRKATYERFNKSHDREGTKLKYEFTAEPSQSITIDADKDAVTKG